MNIGFDLDKIFIDYPPFVPDIVIDRLYKKRANGILEYRIPSRWEIWIRQLSHHTYLRPPITENIDLLKKLLPRKEHSYYLISSRFSFLKKTTDALIKRHEFDKLFNKMFFNYKNIQPHIFKNDILKIANIHTYVDDDLPLLIYLSKKNPSKKFFWLNNKKNFLLKKNVTAITHLGKLFD